MRRQEVTVIRLIGAVLLEYNDEWLLSAVKERLLYRGGVMSSSLLTDVFDSEK